MPISIPQVSSWSQGTPGISSFAKPVSTAFSPGGESSGTLSAFGRYTRSASETASNSTSGASYSVVPLGSDILPVGSSLVHKNNQSRNTSNNNHSTPHSVSKDMSYNQMSGNGMQTLMYSLPTPQGPTNFNSMSSQLQHFRHSTDNGDHMSHKSLNGLQTLSALSTLPSLPSQPSLTSMSSFASLPTMSVISPTSSLASPPPAHTSSSFSRSPMNIQISDSAANDSTDPNDSDMWVCYYGCGKSYKKSSGRSIRRHVVACFRAHWPGGDDLSEEQISTLIAQEQDKGQLVTGLRRWKMRQSRRLANQLPEHERWFCPWECGQFYRSTSSRSIQRHALQCPKRPAENDSSVSSSQSSNNNLTFTQAFPVNSTTATSSSSMSRVSSSLPIVPVMQTSISAQSMTSNNTGSMAKNDAAAPLSSSTSSFVTPPKTSEKKSASERHSPQNIPPVVRPLPTAPALYSETSNTSFGRLTSENMLTDAGKLSKVDSTVSPFYPSFVNLPRVSSSNDNLYFSDSYPRQISQSYTPPLSWNRQISSNNNFHLNSSSLLPLGPGHSRSASLFSIGNVDNNANPSMVDSSLESIRNGRRGVAINLQQLLQSVLSHSDISHPVFTRSFLPIDLLLRLLHADLSSDRSDGLIEELSNAINNSDRVGRLESAMSLSASMNSSSASLPLSTLSTLIKSASTPPVQPLDHPNKDSTVANNSNSGELTLPEQSSLSCLISASSLLNAPSANLPSAGNMYGQSSSGGLQLRKNSTTPTLQDISNHPEYISAAAPLVMDSFVFNNNSFVPFTPVHPQFGNQKSLTTPMSHEKSSSNVSSKSLLWHCPNRCGVSLKLTSCKSIAKHRAACTTASSSVPLPTREISSDTGAYQSDDLHNQYESQYHSTRASGRKTSSNKTSSVSANLSTTTRKNGPPSKIRKLN